MTVDSIVEKESIKLGNGSELPIENWYKKEPEQPQGELLYPGVSNEEAKQIYSPFNYLLHILRLKH